MRLNRNKKRGGDNWRLAGGGWGRMKKWKGKALWMSRIGWRDNMRENGVKQKQPGPMR